MNGFQRESENPLVQPLAKLDELLFRYPLVAGLQGHPPVVAVLPVKGVTAALAITGDSAPS